MTVIKGVLLWFAAHWAMLLTVGVLVGRMVAPVVPGVETWVKAHLPRLAHSAAAVDNFVKHAPNLGPFAKSAFAVFTGESWEQASAVQRAS